MLRKTYFPVFVIALFLATPANAKNFKTYTFPICSPGSSLDGTQVYDMVWEKGDCRKHRIPIRIVDFRLQALCFVEVPPCIPLSEMTDVQRAYYKRMKSHAKVSKVPFAYCVQQTADKTWSRTMLTTKGVAKSYGCSPAAHTIRTIDTLSGRAGRGCVYFGSKQIGCVPLNSKAGHLTN